MALQINKQTGDIAASTGSVSFDGTVRGNALELIEYADLSNAGAEDLTSYELSHEMVSGYTYFLKGRNCSVVDDNTYIHVRFRSVGGTLRTGASDYYVSGDYATQIPVGINSEAYSGIPVWHRYWIGAPAYDAGYFYGFEMFIHNPMNASRYTAVIDDCSLYGAVQSRSYVSAHCNYLEAHDQITVGAHSGNMASGDIYLYRYKDPS